jgi:hypothetical protein
MIQHFDLVICVFGCDTLPNYAEQILNINNTWGKECVKYSNIKLLFFLGEIINEYSIIGDDFIHLKNVKDDYLSASYKQYLGLKYIHENLQYNFVFCCGTDTYINIHKMIKYINTHDYNKNSYIGGNHEWYRQIGDQNIRFHAGGSGFFLSQTCLTVLHLLSLETLVDKWIEICKFNNISQLIPACDVSISYFIHIFNPTCEMIIDNNSHFFDIDYKIAYKWSNRKYNNIITCHRMTTNDFYDFTQILIDNHFFNK